MISAQLPTQDQVFLDHVGFFVRDLEDAGRRLTRLGFEPSPINLQQNADAQGVLRPSGTSNRLASTGFGFLEVLAATHDTPLAAALKAALDRYDGLHLIAFSHADIPAQRRRLMANGFRMQEVVNLRRHKQVDGQEREVRWSVLRPETGVMPEGRVQFAYCHTPELTWAPDAKAPPNGAIALTDTLVIVGDRNEAAARFARYAGRTSRDDGIFADVTLDRGALVFAEPASAAQTLPSFGDDVVPKMAGQAIRADLSAARAAFTRSGLAPIWADDELVCVGPDDALGSCLLFHAASVVDPWRELRQRVLR